MKKLLTILLTIAMAFSLSLFGFAGCTSRDVPDGPGGDPSTPEEPEDPEDPDTPSETQRYKHVVFIGVDGAGDYYQEADTPNIDKIFGKDDKPAENGAYTYDCRTVYPAISGQNWSSMIYGVAPKTHKLHNNNMLENKWPEDSPYPSIFKKVFSARPDAEVGAFINWKPVYYGGMEESLYEKVQNCSYASPDGDQSWQDEEITRRACKYIVEKKPDFLFMHLGEPDAAGECAYDPNIDMDYRKGGFGSDMYLTCIEETDDRIGRIYNALEEADILDDTLIVSTTDHGGTNRAHGEDGDWDEESHVFFGVHGKNVKKGKIQAVSTRDVNAVLSYGMEADIPALDINGYCSQVPDGLFTDAENLPAYQEVTLWDDSTNASTATPAVDAAGGLKSLALASKLKTAVTFDGTADDLVGTTETEAINVTYHKNGIYGSAAVMGAGACVKTDIRLGTDSFAFGFWISMNPLCSYLNETDPVLIGNNDFTDGANPGVSVYYRPGDAGAMFNYADGTYHSADEDRINAQIAPKGGLTGWHHLMVSVARDGDGTQVTTYLDFEQAAYKDFSDFVGGNSFDVEGQSLYLGEDGTGSYNTIREFGPWLMDDFLLFNDVIDGNNVDELGDYYGKYEEKPVITERTDLVETVGAENLTAAYLFNGSAKDEIGEGSISTAGIVSYRKGYISIGGSSYAELPDTLGESDFAVAFWSYMDLEAIPHDAAVFSDGNWDAGGQPGITLSYRHEGDEGKLKLSCGNGDSDYRQNFVFPVTKDKSWMHIVFSYDFEANTITVYANFELVETVRFGTSSNDNLHGFVSDRTYKLGNDGTGSYEDNAHAHTAFDDCLVYNRAVSAGDVTTLQTYYSSEA